MIKLSVCVGQLYVEPILSKCVLEKEDLFNYEWDSL
jgi:hypothetical protein